MKRFDEKFIQLLGEVAENESFLLLSFSSQVEKIQITAGKFHTHHVLTL